MKLLFVTMSFYFSLYSMKYEEHIEQCIERAKKDSLFCEELKAPVFVDHKGDEYGFVVNKSQNKELYSYTKIVKEKRLHEKYAKKKTRKIKKIKEKERSDIRYQGISLLCIILGHISGIW